MKIEPYSPIDKDGINMLLDEIEQMGCNCDMIKGYSCNIHKYIDKIRHKIKDPISVSEN